MRPLGIYVHFPWCLQKCPYCDFVSYATDPAAIDHRRYADAVLAELDLRNGAFADAKVETVFFGGGTPSLWDANELGRVLSAILEAGNAASANDVEITVECNPTSLDEDRARALLGAGVNRLSIGVQGFDAERLRFLGRLHGPDGGRGAVAAAVRAGAPRISGDLIYGVAGGRVQGVEEAADEARELAELGVTHVSAYSLTIEPETRFGALARRGRLPLSSDDAVADAFLAIERTLEARGFEHYEISNYARKGHEARHNLGYWRGHDYLGLGCAAYGTLSNADGSATRYRNAVDPERYMRVALARDLAIDSDERLDPETRVRERIMLGLRTREGVDLEAVAADVGVDPLSEPRRSRAARLERAGRLVVEPGRLRLPKAAWLFADAVAADLF